MKSRPTFALIFALSFGVAAAGDWPQFRGPSSTGTAPGATIPAEPQIEWSVPLPGRGLSSPIIIGDRLFVTCSSGPQQESLQMICLNSSDGSKRWERQLKATGRTTSHPKTSVAACTPCSDGNRVFAQWSCNDVAAFDLDGNLLWLRGLTTDYPNASNSLGMASSPIVVGDTLVVMIENDSESYSLGLDVKTGRNLWKLDRPKAANWTSPLAFHSKDEGSRTAIVLQSGKGLIGIDPVSGSQLWEYPNGASTMSSSVVSDGTLIAVSNGLTALKPNAGGDALEPIWQARQMNPSTISPLALEGRIYSINGAGVISTADAKTGEVGWKLRLKGPFSASPVGSEKRLLTANETGLVQIVDVSGPEGVTGAILQLPLNAETKELVLGTPSLSGEKVYMRTDSTLWRIGAK